MAQSSPADLVALIRAAVFASSATHAGIGAVSLNAYISGRVQPENLIDADAKTIDLPVLIVDISSGGGLEYSGGYQRIPFRLYSYAKTSGEAWAISSAAFSVLQGMRLVDSSGAVAMAGVARQVMPGECVYNDKMQAFAVVSSWIATVGG